ncbi:hypothetical protein BBJ28_00009031 [Nothophytophthora sp. Chile5]|nr:hypothetical protein BBJ28_00009031 [Nothophytophthora sp. Chile5]
MVATTAESRPGGCGVCGANAAVLRCHACELDLCAACSQTVHQASATRHHLTDGAFRFFYGARSDSQPSTTSAPGSPTGFSPVPETDSKEQVASEADVTLGSLDATEQQQSEEAEAYDLWSGWSVRSFSDRSASVDSNAQWRSFRSLSIDSSRGSDDALPLTSIAQSLQSLALAPALADGEVTTQPFIGRPRSYSDYTSLRSQGVGELWHEPSVALTRPSPSLEELGGAMKTDFASRHVVVQSATGGFEADDVRRINDTLNNFGSVASTREEFVSEGLLFCTFFELKSAIGAVKMWLSDPSIGCSETIAFCLPYERPDDVNSATILVRLSGPPVSTNMMRQFCARFGEVASVLQHDMQVNRYIVEYNDSRALPGALSGLACSFHPSGPLTVARTTSPTLDVTQLQLFQECLERLPPRTKTRPKSFSSSTTSLLTSPTSSVASSLNASFLETAAPQKAASSPMKSIGASSTFPGAGSRHSPVLSGLSGNNASHGQREEQIWTRPVARARSQSSSAHLGSLLASHASRGFGDSPAYSNPYALSNASAGMMSSSASGYAPFQPAHLAQQPHHPSYQAASLPLQQQPHNEFRGRMRTPTKFATNLRNGYNDVVFRPSAANASHHSSGSAAGSVNVAYLQSGSNGGRVTSGRNDQGTGEFSLSIERVASGQDKRTTLMIRNIPNKYTQQMLLAEINQRHRGNYDFFYLPIDFKNKCNMGYAFINFMEAAHIEPFYKEFDSQKWTNFNSEKVCAISYARLQGKQAMIARFQNSSLLEKHESYRPLVFGSSGPNRGKQEPFPAPKQPLHKKQAMYPHHHQPGVDNDYGTSAPHRMYTHHHPPHQLQQLQQHLLPIPPHHFMGMPQHHAGMQAMPPLPAAHGLHFGVQTIPPPFSHHHLPSYQQHDPQLAAGSRFLFGMPGMPSGALDYTR